MILQVPKMKWFLWLQSVKDLTKDCSSFISWKKKKKLNNFVPTSLTLARWAMPHNNVFCLNIFIDIRFIYLIKSWKWLASQSLSSLHLKFDPHWVFYFYDFFLSTFHHPGINFLHMNSDMPYESWTPINSSKNICQYIQHFLK